jgi:uncharacterized protein (DUF2235 family)
VPESQEQFPPGGQPEDAPKAILLFSDGTGNSSAKLFKTNVWRMYEAADLGPASAGKRKQIAFYDNGVGTSGFRPFAMLAGIFGFGLNSNVRKMYRYVCRNYTPRRSEIPGTEAPPGGDELYAFGFSRGAFTIRVLIALIADQGLVHAESETDLRRKSNDAFRAFRAQYHPRRLAWPTLLVRGIRDSITAAWRRSRGGKPYDRTENHHPVIRFVGVWDTVAAYGGPIIEITRGIDNWIYALSMPNYQLSPRVQRARHALAIDDERDAFHPLLWDEVHEERLVRGGVVPQSRLQQVWFTGMHADVGGGYPDESLSFVSFLWMLNEARAAGLRSLRTMTDRFRALANSDGPLHNSRAGIGAYYRYQPRNIGAWVHPPDTESIVHDPQLVGPDGKKQGLLTRVQVHESVIARIRSRTDRYAPFNLPDRFSIVPDPQGETLLQRDDLTPEVPEGNEEEAPPLLPPDVRARATDLKVGAARRTAMAAVWDLVWKRRVVYFATLGCTILLLSMPWWVTRALAPPVLADGRTWIGGVIRMLSVVTPDFLDPLIECMANNSFYFLLLVLTIAVLLRRSGSLERRLRDRARRIWCETLTVEGALPEAGPASWIQAMRTSLAYRRPFRLVKWTLLPALTALTISVLAVWLFLGTIAQLWLAGLERRAALCPADGDSAPLEAVRFDFSPSKTCVPAAGAVERRQRYIIEIEMIEPWKDSGRPSTPEGLAAGRLGLAGYAGIPFRRVIPAYYLEPLLGIRRGPGWLQSGERVHISAADLQQVPDRPFLWRATFIAPRTGELMLFSNDVVVPGLAVNSFYINNDGSACVTIWRADLAARLPPAAPEGSACAKADRRAARRADAEEQRRLEAEKRRRAIIVHDSRASR